jgi:hypothetical protein
MRDLFGKVARAAALVVAVSVPVSFVNGLVTDDRSIPQAFSHAANVTLDASHRVGAFTRRTVVWAVNSLTP